MNSISKDSNKTGNAYESVNNFHFVSSLTYLDILLFVYLLIKVQQFTLIFYIFIKVLNFNEI